METTRPYPRTPLVPWTPRLRTHVLMYKITQLCLHLGCIHGSNNKVKKNYYTIRCLLVAYKTCDFDLSRVKQTLFKAILYRLQIWIMYFIIAVLGFLCYTSILANNLLNLQLICGQSWLSFSLSTYELYALRSINVATLISNNCIHVAKSNLFYGNKENAWSFYS